jgi:hypothetical protein
VSYFTWLESAANLTTRGLPMSSNKPFLKNWTLAFSITLSLILIWGCASNTEKNLERLDKTLRIYNNSFESKSEDGGSGYVLNDYRMDYLLKYGDIQGRVAFLQAQTLNIAYFKDGKPLEVNDANPDGEVDEAVITMRYKVTISPSNRLKTFIHEQRWKLKDTTWRLEPNLKPFLQ